MKTLRTIALIVSALGGVVLSTAPARAEWKFLGPSPNSGGDNGRVISIVAHPTENFFYIGAASGGVWKSQNGMYTPLTDQMPVLSIGALALDPKNPSIIYAGTGEPHAAPHAYYGVGIYKSIDAG